MHAFACARATSTSSSLTPRRRRGVDDDGCARGVSIRAAPHRRPCRRRRCARVAVSRAGGGSGDGDDDDNTVVGPTSAHVGDIDVSVKRTAPRAVNEVQRTSGRRASGAKTTMSAKESRRTRRFQPDVEFHGLVKVRKSGMGVTESSERERFPYVDGFAFDSGAACSTEDMLDIVGPLLSEDRKLRLENVLNCRTFSLMPILEGIYDIGNMLAVCRSTEALGIGSVSIISSEGLSFKASGRTSGGAMKWQNIEKFTNTTDALKSAKQKGYRILTTEFEGAYPLSHYDWTIPTAVIFGNEREGISDEARAMADGAVFVPMYGFTESLNISVAAAMVMSHAVADRERRQGFHGDLSDEEKRILRSVYMSRLIPNYARQGYLEMLVERHMTGKSSIECADEDDDGVCEELLDEQLLLAELDASKLVGRRLPKRDLGFN
jgi:tRNA (guanosine-2'-O-)-methyltransferase